MDLCTSDWVHLDDILYICSRFNERTINMEEYLLDGLTVKEHLLQLAEEGNHTFAMALHPGVEHVLGIRLPDLRKLARRIAKDDWIGYLDTVDTFYMEERMLQGLVLGYITPDADLETYLRRVTCFVWNINSWSVCDVFTFAGGKDFVNKHAERIWQYLVEWMGAEGEYEIRFGVVMAMRYFVDEVHLTALFDRLDNIRHEGYYVKMAVAWALSECFVKYPALTLDYLNRRSLGEDTYRKALQKIIESRRVDDATKQKIRAMKMPS